MKKIYKIKLDLDYRGKKMNDVITFADTKDQQKEALEIINSGIGQEFKPEGNTNQIIKT